MENNNDIDHIYRVLRGNTDAFEFLVKKYQNMVFTIAMKIAGNREEAEDIAQEAFVKCYQSLKSYNFQSAFSTWLYKITYNHSIDKLRKHNRKWKTAELKDGIELHDPPDHWVDDIDLKMTRMVLKEAIARLSAEEQVIITLYYFDDRPLKDIAKIISVNENHAKIKLHRIRLKLHKYLRSKNEIISILNL